MKRALNILEVPALIFAPCVLVFCAVFPFDQSGIVSMAAVCVTIVVFFAAFEASRPPLRQIMPTVVLGALAAAGRILFAPIPDFKPVSAICILAGAVFGRRQGFLVGAIAALVSNFFFGQGSWTPWQMYGWGLVGYLGGVLAAHGVFEKRLLLYLYGFLSGLLYGALLNAYYIVGFVHPITWESIGLALLAALPLDCTHGVATVIFLRLIYVPWERKLMRIKKKYALADTAADMEVETEAATAAGAMVETEAAAAADATVETAASATTGAAAETAASATTGAAAEVVANASVEAVTETTVAATVDEDVSAFAPVAALGKTSSQSEGT